ncbi:MAG: alpha-amylase family glycosyl hydrolase [Polyangia bacterium]
MRGSPLIHEVNTWVWLDRWQRRWQRRWQPRWQPRWQQRLQRRSHDRDGHGAAQQQQQEPADSPGAERDVDLGSLPEEALDELTGLKRLRGGQYDAVWLMGVWERSPAARSLARRHPEVRAECQRVLPDLSDADLCGSPYAVHGYRVDPALGGDAALDRLRARLLQRGVALILDLVPNHVALDHPWLLSHPDAFVRGSEAALREHPEAYFRHPLSGEIFAHGRDPHFPPWTDTAQVDAQSPVYRGLLIETLRQLTARCDGVRCDMAMLLVRGVFERTWEGSRDPRRRGAVRDDTPTPETLATTELWPEVIAAVRGRGGREGAPRFLFLAEVYWDMEAELQAMGFDLTYDKRLYDRLRGDSPGAVRDHLLADAGYQARSLRFIENHDEPRANTALSGRRGLAAAVLALTLPGGRLVHDGQAAGLRLRLPVQLGRGPDEAVDPPDPEVEALYARLLPALARPVFHDGTYLALGSRPLYGDDVVARGLIAHAWQLGDELFVVAVNYGREPLRARLLLPPLPSGRYRLTDVLHDDVAPERSADELRIAGLEILLDPFAAHLFRVDALPPSELGTRA